MFAKTATQVNLFRIICLCLLVLTCANSQAADQECSEDWHPTSRRTSSDDLFYTDLAHVLDSNIHALAQRKSPYIQVCGKGLSTSALVAHYTNLKEYISHHSPLEIAKYIDSHFTFCRPSHILLTGYYEPMVPASLVRTTKFPHPLYTAPQDADRRHASRKTIETTNLLKNEELVYVADPFTAFTIHIQGSALLILADGSTRQIHYQADNGRPYTSIGRILIDQGLIPPEAMSMQAIKRYILDHPRPAITLMHTNERFIYFSLKSPTPTPTFPSGSFNIPLTPERSIALDPTIYPQGLLLYLQGTLPVPIKGSPSTIPQFHRREFSRFTLNQDSGNAIQGSTRVDLFMGRGQWAEAMAGEMQERGCLRVLLPK